jgi:O-antigen ligase
VNSIIENSQPFIYQIKEMKIHKKIFIISTILLVVGLPLSPFLVSFGQILLMLNWIVEGKFNTKLSIIKSNKILWAFMVMPIIHIIWLINTTDFQYAFHDLKIKIPLLIMPLVIGTSNYLGKKELRWILNAFVFAVFSGSMVSLAILLDVYHVEINDVRNISIFISYIRFGLMVALSILILWSYLVEQRKLLRKNQRIGLSVLILWFIVFLILLQSITGWIALFIILIISYIKVDNIRFKLISGVIVMVIVMLFLYVAINVYKDFHTIEKCNFSELPEYTEFGNKYQNDTVSKEMDNGHYTNILICKQELKDTWEELSNIPFDKYDANGYRIEKTMVRYLTSKGLTKDRRGLLSLDKDDIVMIEKGYANHIFKDKFALYVRLYSVLQEIDDYKRTGDANNKSVVQRIEFEKAALHIIKNNFWFGIGVGDLRQEYKKAYIDINSNLLEKNRLRAHNQYITFFVTFGIFGFLLSMYSILYPGIVSLKKENLLLLGFLLIMLMSMFNEDTLETQAGVTFYIVFYTLFVFAKQEKDD